MPKKKKKKSKLKPIKTKIVKKVPLPKKVNLADQKIEIKKIKKQATEKKEYSVNDFVVYPKHGVGKIISVEKATIGDIGINFYKILIERDKLTLTIPINQQSHLRPISSINQINKCVSILKTKPKIIIASDPIFHSGPSRYAEIFRENLIEAMNKYGTYFIFPLRDAEIYEYHLPNHQTQLMQML